MKKSNFQGSGFRVQGSEEKFADHLPLYPIPCTLYPEKGFTLLELMVTSSILVMIGLAILTTFGSGFHVFERLQTYGGAQADVLLSLEEMERDLSNTFPSSTIGFTGDARRLSFPSVIETEENAEDGEEIVGSSLGQTFYYMDAAGEEKALRRARRSYSQAVKGSGQEDDQDARLAPVKDVRFRYYSFDEENAQYSWKGSWEEEEGLPRAVEITLTYEDQGQDIAIVRTVLIPAEKVVDELIGSDDEDDGEEDA